MVETTHTPRVVLVTGGAGFIGSNFIRHLYNSDDSVTIINLDVLTYAGVRESLEDLEASPRYHFEHGDICDEGLLQELFIAYDIDTVVHFAAESHVDRSIDGPGAFIKTNVLGTYNLLNTCRERWEDRQDVRFHHVSTDEVYGSLGADGLFTEDTPYDPSSPYSASKASSDHLVRAWHRTFNLPMTLSNCSNNYGPYQFPEKLLPLMIANALDDKPLPVYGDGSNVRDWLYVVDHCEAIDRVVRCGQNGRTYNIGGHNEWTNLDIVHLLCDTLAELRPRQGDNGYRSLIVFVEDRPGHDQRYAIDASRIADELDWKPQETFETGLRKTIQWYLDHEEWVDNIRGGNYSGERLGLKH